MIFLLTREQFKTQGNLYLKSNGFSKPSEYFLYGFSKVRTVQLRSLQQSVMGKNSYMCQASKHES